LNKTHKKANVAHDCINVLVMLIKSGRYEQDIGMYFAMPMLNYYPLTPENGTHGLTKYHMQIT
jgi:hypothetical protein